MSTLQKEMAKTAIVGVFFLSACNNNDTPTEIFDGEVYTIVNTGGTFYGNTSFGADLPEGSIVTVIGGKARFTVDQTGNDLNISADQVSGSKFSGDNLTMEATKTTVNLKRVSGNNPDISAETGVFVHHVDSNKGTYYTLGEETGDVIGITSTPQGTDNTFTAHNINSEDGTGKNTFIGQLVSAKHVSDGTRFEQVASLTVGSAETTGTIACSATMFNNASHSTTSEVIFDQTVYPVPTDGETRSFSTFGISCD